jgi:uncharacterized protein YbjT (DUF2867 family)
MKVIIFGASGLIGNELLNICLNNNAISHIKIVVRKKLAMQHDKLEQIVADYMSIDQHASLLQGDVLFNCLGTTIRQAGSQAAQYQIDCEYPVKAAQLTAANGVGCCVNVSSVGSSESGNFYLRTKAAMEKGVTAAFGTNAYFLRPSFLTGQRKTFRLGEKLGIAVFALLNFLLLGSFRKYRSINAWHVAKAMLSIAMAKPGEQVFHYDEIMKMANRIDQ